MPSEARMWRAFQERDPAWDGVFFTGVRTTGIFCRPTCPARKPERRNVEFFPSAPSAVVAGYRPCRRCRPLVAAGAPPPWLAGLLEAVEEDPTRRWRDEDLREAGLDPARVRRWFKRHHGMTFHAYQRARRVGRALGRLTAGGEIVGTAYDHGFESLSGFNEAVRRVAGEAPGTARERPVLRVARLATPLGAMVAAGTEEALHVLEFAERRGLERELEKARRGVGGVLTPGESSATLRLAEELDAYFRGELRAFTVPLALRGTPFQEAVWRELTRIPWGETRSYAEQARAMGRPEAVRAVARANGANRLAVVVPCHRVVGSDGRLTGYGGGLWRKRRLLELERG